jgi:apolipoprotein N-acyltransferase
MNHGVRPALPLLHGLARGAAALTGPRRYALATALGAGLSAALAPLYAVPLLFIAFTGLVWLVAGSRSLGAAAATGWWFGFGHFLTGLYWVALAFYTDPERFGWMAPFALLGLAGGLAVFPAAATALTWLAGRQGLARGAGVVLALGVAWTVMEWLRGHVLTGFPWNLAGYAWAFSDAMIQPAAVIGVYGLSLLTVVLAAMPATLGAPARSRLRALAPVAVAAAVLAALWIAGAARLAEAGPPGSYAMVPGVGLRIVQPNIDQRRKWQAELREAHLARYLDMTVAPGPRLKAGPLQGAPVTHAIWPETAAPFFLEHDSAHRAAVAQAAPLGGLVITGAPRATPRGARLFRVWNSVLAVDSEGAIAGSYDKFHLVPFGEYVPLRRFIDSFVDVAKITPGAIDFSAGPGPRTLRLAGLPPVSPLICYEAIFPGAVVDPGDRPAWLLNLTNDGWFGISSGPYQHFEAARLRAVEEGLPLVRAANTGISGVIDPYGRVRTALGLGRAGVIDSGLPAALPEATVYARLGDWTLLALLVAAGALAGALARRL